MKIIIAADIFPPQPGGPATYSATIANELKKDGWEVCVVSLNPQSDKSAVFCPLFAVRPIGKIWRYLEYLYLLFKHGIGADIIYAMGPVNAGLPALLVAKLLRKRLLVKVVGDYAWEQWQNTNSQTEAEKKDYIPPENFAAVKTTAKIKILKFVERFVTRRAERVIVPSVYLKKIVGNWGVKAENIAVVYNAVEFGAVEPIVHTGEKWLVSVGRLVPWKGFDTIIALMPDLLKEFPGLKFKIIGSGPQMENYKLRITNYELGGCVELLGGLSRDKTLSYIQSADIFILNTGYEGLSHVILEALDCGTSILASRAGGNPELLEEENLFAYNDKEEIKNKILRALKGELNLSANRRDMSQFKFETMIANTKKILCAS